MLDDLDMGTEIDFDAAGYWFGADLAESRAAPQPARRGRRKGAALAGPRRDGRPRHRAI